MDPIDELSAAPRDEVLSDVDAVPSPGLTAAIGDLTAAPDAPADAAEWVLPGVQLEGNADHPHVQLEANAGHPLLAELTQLGALAQQIGAAVDRSLRLSGATARVMLTAIHTVLGQLESLRLAVIRRSLADEPDPGMRATGKATRDALVESCRRTTSHARSDMRKARLLDPDIGPCPSSALP